MTHDGEFSLLLTLLDTLNLAQLTLPLKAQGSVQAWGAVKESTKEPRKAPKREKEKALDSEI